MLVIVEEEWGTCRLTHITFVDYNEVTFVDATDADEASILVLWNEILYTLFCIFQIDRG